MAQARERTSIQVISRAAEVLRTLEHETAGLSLGVIAGRVNLARSTVQRIVASLVEEKFLMPASSNGRVKLGPALVRLGRSATTDMVGLARPYLVELSRTVGETVDLSILSDNQAIFIDQVAGSHRLAAISRVGTAFPLHSTANGKALLACLPKERRRTLLRRPLANDTDATITDPELLEQQVRATIASGIAYDIEEHTDGICAVGTALLDAFDRPLALSIPVPKTRYDRIEFMLKEPLIATRDDIVKRVAGNVPGEAQ